MPPLTLQDTRRFEDRPTLKLSDVDSLQVLESNVDVEVLVIEHFPRVTSLAPLRSLKKLRFLSLSTSAGWDGSGNVLAVESFEPLAALSDLTVLNIHAVVPTHDGVVPLAGLECLERISIGGTSFYQLEDFAFLAQRLSKAQKSLRPISQMNFKTRCRKCRSHDQLFLEGARPRSPRYVCPGCDRKKIVSHLERWNAAGGVPRFEGPESLTIKDLVSEFSNPNAR